MSVRSFPSVLWALLGKKDLKNDLTLHLKELEKEEQTKPKGSRRKEKIFKIRAATNEMEKVNKN